MTSLVKLSSIGKVFVVGGEEVRALNEVELEIDHGEYVALVGQSGSGKSTLMNIIGFLDAPSCGTYTFQRDDTTGYTERQLAVLRATQIGFVYQNFNLLPRSTALENVMRPLIYQDLPRGLRRPLALEALRQVGLDHRASHLPNQLSGGQRQRVAIARALCAGPSLLIADEPTGNLDSATSAEVLSIFDRLHADGTTIIMVTHEPSIAQRCRRIVTLSDGRIMNDERS